MSYQIAKINWKQKEFYNKSNRKNENSKINLKKICLGFISQIKIVGMTRKFQTLSEDQTRKLMVM